MVYMPEESEKDGKKVVKVTPNPEGEGGSLGINLDAYGLDGKTMSTQRRRLTILLVMFCVTILSLV